jgi:hypothetical protein
MLRTRGARTGRATRSAEDADVVREEPGRAQLIATRGSLSHLLRGCRAREAKRRRARRSPPAAPRVRRRRRRRSPGRTQAEQDPHSPRDRHTLIRRSRRPRPIHSALGPGHNVCAAPWKIIACAPAIGAPRSASRCARGTCLRRVPPSSRSTSLESSPAVRPGHQLLVANTSPIRRRMERTSDAARALMRAGDDCDAVTSGADSGGLRVSDRKLGRASA